MSGIFFFVGGEVFRVGVGAPGDAVSGRGMVWWGICAWRDGVSGGGGGGTADSVSETENAEMMGENGMRLGTLRGWMDTG